MSALLKSDSYEGGYKEHKGKIPKELLKGTTSLKGIDMGKPDITPVEPTEAEKEASGLVYNEIEKLKKHDYAGKYGYVKLRKPFVKTPSYLYYNKISRGVRGLPYSELETMSEEIKQVDALIEPLSFVHKIKDIKEALSKDQHKLLKSIMPKYKKAEEVDDVIYQVELVTAELVRLARERVKKYTKRHFAYYVFYCDPQQSPTDSTHLIYLCETAQKVIEGVLNPRLLVAIPPGTAKTQTITVKLSTWFIGRLPRKRVLILSYGDTFMRKEVFPHIKTIMTSEWYRELFPKVFLDSNLKTLEKYGVKIRRNGEYVAAGSISMRSVGQGIIGVRGDLVITDDLFSGYAAATSPTLRAIVKDWLSNDVLPRLLPGCIQIMVNARWSASDPQSDIIRVSIKGSEHYNKDAAYEVVEIPLKAVNDNDPLGRTKGELIWPKFYPDSHWTKQFANMNTNTIMCQYYCMPTDGSVSGFDPKTLQYYHVYPNSLGEDYYYTLIAIDAANKAKETSDDTVMTVWRIDYDDKIYLVDCRAGKWDSLDILNNLAELKSDWKADQAIIEDAGIAPAVVTNAQYNNRLYGNLKLVPHKNKSKEFRFSSVLHLFRDSKVFFPSRGGSWLTEMMLQLTQFGSHPNDDYVDSLSLGLKYLVDTHLKGVSKMGQIAG